MGKKEFKELNLSDDEMVIISGTSEEIPQKEELVQKIFDVRNDITEVMNTLEFVLSQREESYSKYDGFNHELYSMAFPIVDNVSDTVKKWDEILGQLEKENEKIYGKNNTLPKIQNWMQEIMDLKQQLRSLITEVRRDVFCPLEKMSIVRKGNDNFRMIANRGRSTKPSQISPYSSRKSGGHGPRNGNGHR